MKQLMFKQSIHLETACSHSSKVCIIFEVFKDTIKKGSRKVVLCFSLQVKPMSWTEVQGWSGKGGSFLGTKK